MRKVLSPEGVPTQIVRSPDVVCPIVRKTDDIAEIVRHPDDLCRGPHGYPAGKRHGWHDYVRAGESVVFRRMAAPSREELEVLVQRLKRVFAIDIVSCRVGAAVVSCASLPVSRIRS